MKKSKNILLHEAHAIVLEKTLHILTEILKLEPLESLFIALGHRQYFIMRRQKNDRHIRYKLGQKKLAKRVQSR